MSASEDQPAAKPSPPVGKTLEYGSTSGPPAAPDAGLADHLAATLPDPIATATAPTPGATTPAAPDAATLAQDGASALATDHTMLSTDTKAGPVDTMRTYSSPQITVLPRVTFEDRQPTFVHAGKTRYEMKGPLGEGGVGEVFEAVDHDIGRRVALKRLRGEFNSPVALARFLEEIRTTGHLEHPNVIPIHDVGVDEQERYYFIMKYVDGETLESIIAKLRQGDPDYHRRYGFERRTEIFKAVLSAMAYAHEAGFVHRDLKPANIMVGAFGEVMVMDWGIARPLRPQPHGLDDSVLKAADPGAAATDALPPEKRPFATQVGAIIGTPAYMAPEQAQGQPADERTDIYALSVMFHELLSLQHYLADRTSVAETLRGTVDTEVPMAAYLKSSMQGPVPADLAWFIHAGVDKDPTKRYPSVRAMLDRLDRRAEGDIPVECPMTFLRSLSNHFLHQLDRHPMLVLGATVMGVLVFLGSLGLAITTLF